MRRKPPPPPTTTTSMSPIELEALSKFGVSSLEELKKKLAEQKHHSPQSDEERFPQMVHLFVIGTGIVTTLIISGIGFSIVKYKRFNEVCSSYADQGNKKSLKRKKNYSDNACPSKFSTAEYKSIHQSSVTAV